MSFAGFLLALATAGASDMEAVTKKAIMSDLQFYMQFLLSTILMLSGWLGGIIRKKTKGRKCHERLRPQKIPNHEAVRHTYHNATKAAYGEPKNRNCS